MEMARASHEACAAAEPLADETPLAVEMEPVSISRPLSANTLMAMDAIPPDRTRRQILFPDSVADGGHFRLVFADENWTVVMAALLPKCLPGGCLTVGQTGRTATAPRASAVTRAGDDGAEGTGGDRTRDLNACTKREASWLDCQTNFEPSPGRSLVGHPGVRVKGHVVAWG